MCEGSGCHIVRDLNSDEQRGNCSRSNNGQQDRTNRPHQPPPVPQTASSSPKQSRKRITACTNCRLTHRKCSEGRPCKTCVALGIADSCQDPPRRKATQYHNIFVDWSSAASGSSRPSRSSTSSSSSSSSSLSFLHHQFSPSVVMTSTDMDSTNNGTLPSFVRNSPEGSKGTRQDGAVVLMISQDKHDDGACSGGDLSRSYDSTTSLSNNDNSTSSNHSCGSGIVSRDQSQCELSSGLVGDFQQSTQLPHVDRTNFGHIQGGGGGGCGDTRSMPPSSSTAPQQQQQQVRSLLVAQSSSPQHEQQQSQLQLQSAQQPRHLLTQRQQPPHVQHQTFNDARTLVSQFTDDTTARLNTDYSDTRHYGSPQLQKHEENQPRQEQQQQPFNSTRTQLDTPHSPSSLSHVVVPVVPPGSSTAQPRTQLESLQTTPSSSNQHNNDGESHNSNNCQRIQPDNPCDPCEHSSCSTNLARQISIRMNNEEKAYHLSPIHSLPEFRKSRGKSSIFPHLETLLPSHTFYTPPTVFFPLCWLKKSTAATRRAGIAQSVVVGVPQVQMSSRVGGVTQQHMNRSRSSSTSPSSLLTSSMAPSISKRKHHRPRSQFPD